MNKSASSPFLRSNKPMSICCYICGREFGTKSFGIHLKSCELKFENEQNQKLNKKDRIKLPSPPQLLSVILKDQYKMEELEKFNRDSYQIYKYKVLPKCKYCQRTFNFQSLKVHEKGCQKKPKGRFDYDTSISVYSSDDQFKKPKCLLCCVCGRQFGTKSLKIHYPQCLQKFRNDQIQRHANPKNRRAPPEFTDQELELINSKEQWTDKQTEEFYKNVMERYRSVAMASCDNCQRKFTVEALPKHTKNCVLINGNLNPDAALKKIKSQKVLHFYQKDIKKPKTLMCYICGRQFGLASLSIHQKSCYQKFKTEQNNKPKAERRKLPELPQEIADGDYNINEANQWSQEKIHKYNDVISNAYNKKTLTQCFICERTFFEESLPKHMVHCQNNLQKLKLKRKRSEAEDQIVRKCESIQKLIKQQKQKSSQKEIPKPRVLMCHICGREYGLTSLQIHLKKCPEKFRNEQMLKPVEDRKKVPELPEELKNQEFNLNYTSEWTNEKIEAYNKTVNDIYTKQSLETCYICNRTFFEESLPKHMKYCEKYTLEKIRKSKSKSEKDKQILSKHRSVEKLKQIKSQQRLEKLDAVKPKTLCCHVCGRQFGLTSLSIHLPKCIEKFHNLENQKMAQDRKKLPDLSELLDLSEYNIKEAQDWSRQKIEQYNKTCSQIYQKQSLTTCEFCNRSFFDEQIGKHLKYCQKQTLRNLSKSKNLNEEQCQLLRRCKSAGEQQFLSRCPQFNDKIRQPKMLVCHVCGREFGLSSLKIHVPKCEQKFVKHEQKKQESQRKKLPMLTFDNEFSKQVYDIQFAEQWTKETIVKYNEKANQVYRKDSLSSCQFCNRSFFTEQLPKHLKFCEKQYNRKKLKLSITEQETVDSTESNNKQAQFLENYSEEPTLLKSASEKLFLNESSMSIIRQEPQEHLTGSPQERKFERHSLNIYDSKQTEKSFQIVPLEISNFMTTSNCENEGSKQQKQGQIYSAKKQQFVEQKKLNFDETTTIGLKDNLTILNSSLKNIKAGDKRLALASDNCQAQQKIIEKSKPTKVECEHCGKRIKKELLPRHLQMCQSNHSMTGYMSKGRTSIK